MCYFYVRSLFIHVIRMEFILLWDNFKIRSKIFIDEKIRIFFSFINRLLTASCLSGKLLVCLWVCIFIQWLFCYSPLPHSVCASHIELPQFGFRFSMVMMPRWHAYKLNTFHWFEIVSLRQSDGHVHSISFSISSFLCFFRVFFHLFVFIYLFAFIVLSYVCQTILILFLKMSSEIQTFEIDIWRKWNDFVCLHLSSCVYHVELSTRVDTNAKIIMFIIVLRWVACMR